MRQAIYAFTHYDPAIAARFAVPILLDLVLWDLWDRVQ
jgi:hypothetical protein